MTNKRTLRAQQNRQNKQHNKENVLYMNNNKFDVSQLINRLRRSGVISGSEFFHRAKQLDKSLDVNIKIIRACQKTNPIRELLKLAQFYAETDYRECLICICDNIAEILEKNKVKIRRRETVFSELGELLDGTVSVICLESIHSLVEFGDYERFYKEACERGYPKSICQGILNLWMRRCLRPSEFRRLFATILSKKWGGDHVIKDGYFIWTIINDMSLQGFFRMTKLEKYRGAVRRALNRLPDYRKKKS